MTLFDSTRTLGVPGGSFHADLAVDQSCSGRAGSTLGGDARGPEHDDATSAGALATCTGRTAEYQLHAVIGSGKFSTVWRGVHLPSHTPVAIKKVQIYEMMDAKQRRDCLNEVRLLQSLHHPNVVRYGAAFVERNELVIAVELCDCGDLGELILERRNMPGPAWLAEGDIWSIFSQLCSALAHMHAHRIIHRDVKPSNVFLTADGVVKLGDLGLSRHLSSKTQNARSMVGTPYYMSPECIRGMPYEWSSDVWSLGCLLYELGALKNPFFAEGLNYYTLGKRITSCEYDALPPHASAELVNLVAAMLKQDASERPSLAELARFAEMARAKHRENPPPPTGNERGGGRRRR